MDGEMVDTRGRATLPVATLAAGFLLSACGGPGGAPADAGGDAGADTATDATPICTSETQCDDGLFCNGSERCDPGSAEADPDGCVRNATSPCAEGEHCSEAAEACMACNPGSDKDGDGSAPASCGGDDCDDGDPNSYPGNTETCDPDGHDEDCDPSTLGEDADGDGFPAESCCNEQADGTLSCGGDCDDDSMEVNPSAPETCNGVDDDCDGIVDEDVLSTYYPDCDGDGVGSLSAEGVEACAAPADAPDGCADSSAAGWSEMATDCDDAKADVHPGAAESCDDTDSDCDGEPWTGDSGEVRTSCWLDGDRDDYAAPDATAELMCECGAGYTPNDPGDDADCDDANDLKSPILTETCDRLDNDCNGSIDDGVGAGDCDYCCDPGDDLAVASCDSCSGATSGLCVTDPESPAFGTTNWTCVPSVECENAIAEQDACDKAIHLLEAEDNENTVVHLNQPAGLTQSMEVRGVFAVTNVAGIGQALGLVVARDDGGLGSSGSAGHAGLAVRASTHGYAFLLRWERLVFGLELVRLHDGERTTVASGDMPSECTPGADQTAMVDLTAQLGEDGVVGLSVECTSACTDSPGLCTGGGTLTADEGPGGSTQWSNVMHAGGDIRLPELWIGATGATGFTEWRFDPHMSVDITAFRVQRTGADTEAPACTCHPW